jgi:hypothetical protein
MTKRQWLACADPQKMLEHLGDKASDRKLRLFACACCRRVWPVLTGSRHAVGLAERYADGRASDDEFYDARGEAELIWDDPGFEEDVARQRPYQGYSTLWSSEDNAAVAVEYCTRMAAQAVAGPTGPGDPERAAQCDLLRCITGDPFRPAALSPACRTPQVVAVARAAYNRRNLPAGTLDLVRLAVLADALEEAGGTDPDILNHCRRPGVHVRGCWVVDLLLGRS